MKRVRCIMKQRLILLLLAVFIFVTACSCGANVPISESSDMSDETESLSSSDVSGEVSNAVDSISTSISESSADASPTTITTIKTSKAATANATTSTVKTTTAVNPLDVPLVFDDPILEQLLRSIAKKPTGNVYPREFSDHFDNRLVDFQYQESDNTTIIYDLADDYWRGEAIGKVNSFKALSTIPFKSIQCNYISDIKYFAATGALESIRIFNSGESIQNLGSLKNCKNLKDILIEGNKGVDLSLLSGMQSIEGLALKDSEVSGYEVLQSFKKLKGLLLYHCSFTDLSTLRNNTSIESLEFDYTTGMDLTILTTLPNLKTLDISNCKDFPHSTYQELSQKGVKITI